jgi:hypothetical protein
LRHLCNLFAVAAIPRIRFKNYNTRIGKKEHLQASNWLFYVNFTQISTEVHASARLIKMWFIIEAE